MTATRPVNVRSSDYTPVRRRPRLLASSHPFHQSHPARPAEISACERSSFHLDTTMHLQQSSSFPGGALMKRVRLLSLILVALFAFSLSAVAASYTFQTVDFPGSTETIVVGMNNAGALVGVYQDQNDQLHGFLDVGGVFTT